MSEYREYYHRHLPHWQPQGATFFVTFRLKGSLPYEIIESLIQLREQEKHTQKRIPGDETDKEVDLIGQPYFVKWDSFLDKSEFGPRWLSQDSIAIIVKEALLYHDHCDYDLHGFCIMPNHVHAVFTPLESKSDCQSDLHDYRPLHKIMQSLKRYTARKANALLGREGAFWQDESYDHAIRNNGEYLRIIHYILENPVKAGLVLKWQDWPWNYCEKVELI